MRRSIVILLCCILLNACSSGNYKLSGTDRAAAVGAIVGAGLGAIIGSQAGDPGVGLALGAVAGGSIGSMIGNQFDSKDEKLASQSEVIETQQQEINSHKSRIEELQRQSQQQVHFQSSDIDLTVEKNAYSLNKDEHSRNSLNSDGASPTVQKESVEYAAVSPIAPKFDNIIPPESKGAYDWKESEKDNRVASQCPDGDAEVALAMQQKEAADKLYHLRRALRICPEKAEYHNAIGEIYVGLERVDDARFEFNEALRINPGYKDAQMNLSQISG